MRPQSGSYTANLLGNIRGHLAGLQGYDVMALELLQNADDAKAATIVFDITFEGLMVRNNGEFTFCGDLTKRCDFETRSDYSCDYHRIVEVGSGAKLSRSENIGRFGIGFLSTYQVTDHPEIRSAGVKLTLFPERGEWSVESDDGSQGTTLFLPWARDPNTAARQALGISHIDESRIDRVVSDVKGVLRQSLLFLRHLRSAEVLQNGTLLLGCDLTRDDSADLIVSVRPGDEAEYWHIRRADASHAAGQLKREYPQLASLDRDTEVVVALRTDPGLLADGSLYAFLPTKQSSGLPLHINADFFPESDRKSVIFAGSQHEQAWNEMLLDAAAAEIARDLEGLVRVSGCAPVWKILHQAYELSKRSDLPSCYGHFWGRLKDTATAARIVPTQDGTRWRPGDVLLTKKPPSIDQGRVLLEVGGRLAAEELRPFWTAMTQLGAPILSLDHAVDLFDAALEGPSGRESQIDKEKLTGFYEPLWSVVEELIPDTPSAKRSIQRLRKVPLVVTEDGRPAPIDGSHMAPGSLSPRRLATLLPGLTIISPRLAAFPKLSGLIPKLNLGTVARHIRTRCASEPVEAIIDTGAAALRDLYDLFADLDAQGSDDTDAYASLRSLPIWRSGRGLIVATDALLPGDFTDPTGRSDLLDTSVLSDRTRDFILHKIGVRRQTIAAYVEGVLPRFFNNDGPRDATEYAPLITELAKPPGLLDTASTRERLVSVLFVPTEDGGWSRPSTTYYRSEDLVTALGDREHLWLDTSRLPRAASVRRFVQELGIRQSPSARDLVERILSIAHESPPTADARKASSEAFYRLCEGYDAWSDDDSFRNAIVRLRNMECLPALDDVKAWHTPGSLYAPYQADAFRSQAAILDFRNTQRLDSDLLKALGITIAPPTKLVIEHLTHCMGQGVGPHISTYQVLNDRARNSDPVIRTLEGTPCIYVESESRFVRTNQVFWGAQQLGRYAYSIPDRIKSFAPLFQAIGVKDAPDCSDYIDILLDVIGARYEQSKPVAGADREVYDRCFAAVANAYAQGQCSASELQVLREAPTILSLDGVPRHPDEILLSDSEWYVNFFDRELDRALCKLPAELYPLAEELGVRRLSESASVSLAHVGGGAQDEEDRARQLQERTKVVARLLHDQPDTVRSAVRDGLERVKAVSYDRVQIVASVRLAGDVVRGQDGPAQAFYDREEGRLSVCRPIVGRSWAHILNAVFHQLIPTATGAEISKLTLGVRPLMEMSVQDAHCELTDAGVPPLDETTPTVETTSQASLEIDALGAADDRADQEHGDQSSPSLPDTKSDVEALVGDAQEAVSVGHEDSTQEEGDLRQRDQAEVTERAHARETARPEHQQRPKHKEQWDRRLLSYVRRHKEETSERGETSSALLEHNLAVEAAARSAVCAYENARGRIPEQKAQTHPGYDIVSVDPRTGEGRLIEVKGVAGEWNQTGVGLSSLQFSVAREHGDSYWLYVVEFAVDPDRIRIHPIRSPATQVTSFMFDSNWRQAAADDSADPS